MSNTCSVCTQTLTQKSPGLACSFCLLFFHAKCVDLTKEQVAILKTISGSAWKCPSCLEKTLASPECENIPCKCVGCKLIPTLLVTIENLSKSVDELKIQIQSKNSDTEPVYNNNSSETIINEINERQKRANNIIIYKLQETQDDDTETIKGIVKDIAPEVNLNNVKTYRLGKKTNTPRPVKVVFDSKEDALIVVKNKSKLKNLKYDVNINMDQTKMQLDYYKSIKSELEARKARGENNLYIRYMNGIPTINCTKN